jgi:hypothetical protein
MNNPNKKAGSSTRKRAESLQKSLTLVLVLGLIIVIVIFFITLNQGLMMKLGPGVILVLMIIVKVLPDVLEKHSKKVDKLERRATRGAVAEEKIGELLEDLGPNFLVIHDVTSRFGNIDHVVMGKDCGLILIETKAHGGTVTFQENTLLVNGILPEKDFIQQTNKNTYWMRDQVSSLVGFKPWITAVIVFSNAFVKAYRPIKGVSVVNKKFLRAYIANKCKPSPQNLQIWEKREEIYALLNS